MRRLGTWPMVAIVAVICAVLGGVAAALWVRHEQKASAEESQTAARIEKIDGQVGINNSLNEQTSNDWVQATPNMPVSAGDRIYTRENSRASIAFTSRNFARLDDGSALDVLELSNDRTQLALRDGSALFDVGYLPNNGLFEVATPYGAVDFNQPGLYQVGYNDNGSVWISVLSGLAQVVGLAGSGQISQGEMLTLIGQTAAQVALSRFDPGYAGGLINDYYYDRYPSYYDGRYRDYNVYLNDPFYYDPYRRYNSYQYVTYGIPGIYDLDPYGDWISLNNYGYGWRPRVDYGWAPYQSGYWINDYPYGLTWVSNEPWGYAPYHYGRWVFVNNQWYWIPGTTSAPSYYSPALVAFLPLSDGIGWLPLGPGDPYAPRYYDQYWQPHYYTRADLRPTQLINLNVPGAIAVVPWQDFNGFIDARHIRRSDWRSLGSVQPILEPLLDTPLRNAALRSAWGRGKIDIPPGIAKRLDTPVVTVNEVRGLPGRDDFDQRLHVQRVSNDAKRARLNIRDERGGNQGAVSNERGRESAPGQVRQSENGRGVQQREQPQQRDQAQGERVGLGRGQAVREQPQQRVQPERAPERARGAARGSRESQPRFVRPPARKPDVNVKPRTERPQPQRTQPQVQRSQPQVHRAQPQMQPARPQVRRSQPQVQRAQPQMERARPQVQRSQPQVQRSQPQVQRAQPQVQRSQQQVQRQQPAQKSTGKQKSGGKGRGKP